MPPTFKSGEPISKSDLNDWVRDTTSLGQLRAGGELEVANTSGGPKLRLGEDTFLAQIVADTPASSSSSSLSSSSHAPLTTACCSGRVFPLTLYLTVDSTSAGCACATGGGFPLHWNDATNKWEAINVTVGSCTQHFDFSLACDSGIEFSWLYVFTPYGVASPCIPSAFTGEGGLTGFASCDPLELFGATCVLTGCCGVDPSGTCQQDWHWVITEAPSSSSSSSSSSRSSSSSNSSSSSSTCCPTCCAGKQYSWEEVTPAGGGTLTAVVGGRTGGPGLGGEAYEENGICTALSTVVTMRRGVAGEYLFRWRPTCRGQSSSSSSSRSSSSSQSSHHSLGCCSPPTPLCGTCVAAATPYQWLLTTGTVAPHNLDCTHCPELQGTFVLNFDSHNGSGTCKWVGPWTPDPVCTVTLGAKEQLRWALWSDHTTSFTWFLTIENRTNILYQSNAITFAGFNCDGSNTFTNNPFSPCTITGDCTITPHSPLGATTAPDVLHLTVTGGTGSSTCLVGGTALLNFNPFACFASTFIPGWVGNLAPPPGCSCGGAGVQLCCNSITMGLLIGGRSLSPNYSNVVCDPFSLTFSTAGNSYCSPGGLTVEITE